MLLVRKLRLFGIWSDNRNVALCRKIEDSEIIDLHVFAREFMESQDSELDEKDLQNRVPLGTGDFDIIVSDMGLHSGIYWESESFFTTDSECCINNDSLNYGDRSW